MSINLCSNYSCLQLQSARSSSISKHVDASPSRTNGGDSSFSTFSPTVESASSINSTPSRMTPPSYETLSTSTPTASLPTTISTEAAIPQATTRDAALASTHTETAPASNQEQEHLEALSSLQAQLNSAQAQIVKLKAELQQSESLASGLRNRSVAASAAPVPDVVKSNQVLVASKSQSGVPVPVVAGLVVGVFVLTWSVSSLASYIALKLLIRLVARQAPPLILLFLLIHACTSLIRFQFYSLSLF